MAYAALFISATTQARRHIPSSTEFLSSSPACPGSPASRHAKCSLSLHFEQPCANVRAEIEARLRAERGWRCPKSHPGRYELLEASEARVRGRRTTGEGATPPGPGQSYTDAFGFDLTSAGSGCEVRACSESQGPSGCDYSTNFCNMRNLYCGSADGCSVVAHDLTVREEVEPSCYHSPRCSGSLRGGLETNKEMCRR